MKKLLFVLMLGLISGLVSAQFLKFAIHETDSIVLTSGDSTMYEKVFYTLEPWSIQFNYGNLDTTASSSAADLYVYSSGSGADSALYDLLWVDLDLDGTNDNPWELSSTLNAYSSSYTLSGASFPYWKLFIEVERDSVSVGNVLYMTFTRSRTENKK